MCLYPLSSLKLTCYMVQSYSYGEVLLSDYSLQVLAPTLPAEIFAFISYKKYSLVYILCRVFDIAHQFS
jgi:hypothetical protein